MNYHYPSFLRSLRKCARKRPVSINFPGGNNLLLAEIQNGTIADQVNALKNLVSEWNNIQDPIIREELIFLFPTLAKFLGQGLSFSLARLENGRLAFICWYDNAALDAYVGNTNGHQGYLFSVVGYGEVNHFINKLLNLSSYCRRHCSNACPQKGTPKNNIFIWKGSNEQSAKNICPSTKRPKRILTGSIGVIPGYLEFINIPDYMTVGEVLKELFSLFPEIDLETVLEEDIIVEGAIAHSCATSNYGTLIPLLNRKLCEGFIIRILKSESPFAKFSQPDSQLLEIPYFFKREAEV